MSRPVIRLPHPQGFYRAPHVAHAASRAGPQGFCFQAKGALRLQNKILRPVRPSAWLQRSSGPDSHAPQILLLGAGRSTSPKQNLWETGKPNAFEQFLAALISKKLHS